MNCLHLTGQQLHGTNSIVFYAAIVAVILSPSSNWCHHIFSSATAVVVFLWTSNRCHHSFDQRFSAETAVVTFSSSSYIIIAWNHKLNMELDLQSLIGLHITWRAQLYSLAETPQLAPSPRIWTRITRALLVSKDRRHLFGTPLHGTIKKGRIPEHVLLNVYGGPELIPRNESASLCSLSPYF